MAEGTPAPQFGVNLNNREPLIAPDYQLGDLLDLSEKVEEYGFDSVWVGDSLFSKPRYEPLALLSAISQRTQRVRLGTACLVTSVRNPLFTALEWATLDVLSGSDYRYPLSRGLDARDDGTPKIHSDDRRFYGTAFPQAYAEFGTSCLSYKVGHFYTLLGNEVVPAIGNVFYSHSYMFLYAYPFTHTGALATYKANSQLTLVGGVNNGWDTFNDEDENINDHNSGDAAGDEDTRDDAETGDEGGDDGASKQTAS